MKYTPYTNPRAIMEFIQSQIQPQVFSHKGGAVSLEWPSIYDYFNSVPEQYSQESGYYNLLLRSYQLMTNEGLLTPLHNAVGFEQKYQLNGFNPMEAKYGKYDFLVLGFQLVRDIFEDAVRPIIIDQKSNPEIGTGFVVNANRSFDDNFYFITARHCLPINRLIDIPGFFKAKGPCHPEAIWIPADTKIDLAIIKFNIKKNIPSTDHNFWLSSPEVLDEVLTMGYPPIPGFLDPIQVAEVSSVSSFVRASTGRISGIGKYYFGGKEDYLLVSARVKGGNSGGPVINKRGEVIGMITEIPGDQTGVDTIGYGVALSADVIDRMIKKIQGESNDLDIETLNFELDDNGFYVRN